MAFNSNEMDSTSVDSASGIKNGLAGARTRTPHQHDILGGRGQAIHSHAGNKQFREWVKVRKSDYILAARTTNNEEKANIAREVLALVWYSQKPPGRFLQKDPSSKGWWVEMDDDRATAKVCQALREGAPAIRAAAARTPTVAAALEPFDTLVAPKGNRTTRDAVLDPHLPMPENPPAALPVVVQDNVSPLTFTDDSLVPATNGEPTSSAVPQNGGRRSPSKSTRRTADAVGDKREDRDMASSSTEMDSTSADSATSGIKNGDGVAVKQKRLTIQTPHQHDILSGRGGAVNAHAGNKQFREWVKVHKNGYSFAPTMNEKAAIAREVIGLVHSQKPPGRFLQKDPSSKGWWDEMDDNRVTAKVRQALREVAPANRAAARIQTPQMHDIVSGRSGAVYSHPGNKQFREWIKVHENNYSLAPTPNEKATVVREVLALVLSQKPPGRFLQKDPSSPDGWWVEMDDESVTAKIRKALQEDASAIRATAGTLIHTPHTHDILGGKGKAIQSHAGNKQFREWVKVRKSDYNLAARTTNNEEKANIAREVLALVWYSQKPPGRFLQKDPSSKGWWVEMDDDRATAKVCQALREGAPATRAVAAGTPPEGNQTMVSGASLVDLTDLDDGETEAAVVDQSSGDCGRVYTLASSNTTESATGSTHGEAVVDTAIGKSTESATYNDQSQVFTVDDTAKRAAIEAAEDGVFM